MVEKKWIEINGEKIYYFEKDNNRRTTIVFVHGFHSSSGFISNLIPLDANYNIVALDLPGNGQSSCNNPPLVESYQKIVVEFINRLDFEEIIVLGHSLGGASAAFASLHCPKVKKVVLLSVINPYMIKDEESREAMRKLIQPGTMEEAIKSVRALIENRQKTIFASNIVPTAKSMLALVVASRGNFRPMLERELLEKNYLQKTIRDLYLSIKKPILMIHGDRDHYVTIESAQRLAKDLNVDLMVIDHCGHAPIYEYPTLMNQFLNQWSKDL